MRNFYKEFFYVPENGKVRDKVMLMRTSLTAVVMVVCLMAMGFSAYAYFSHNITSDSAHIQTAVFSVDATFGVKDSPDEKVDFVKEGSKISAKLKAGKVYVITIDEDKRSNAKTGFCIISADNSAETYHTQQIGVDAYAVNKLTEKLTFELSVTEDTTIHIVPHWGTSSYYTEGVRNYITNENVGDNKILMATRAINELETKYSFSYYSSIESAMEAINGATIGQNQIDAKEKASVGVYTNENGVPVLVLFRDQIIAGTITPAVNMNVNLSGHMLCSKGQVAIHIPDDEKALNIQIDGTVEGSRIEAATRAIQILNKNSTVTINGGTYFAWTNDSSVAANSDAIMNKGTLYLKNVHATGLNCAVTNLGTLNIDGGVYQGYSLGGIYFGGAGTTSNVVNATVEQISIPDGYTAAGLIDNNSGCYVGGSDQNGNNKVYFTKCNIKSLSEEGNAIRFGAEGVENNSVYLSNTVLSPNFVEINSLTHKLYLDKGAIAPDCTTSFESCVIFSEVSNNLAVKDEIVHTVVYGDTVLAIANKYGTTVARICAYNDISDVRKIRTGTQIKIPPADWEISETTTPETITPETTAPETTVPVVTEPVATPETTAPETTDSVVDPSTEEKQPVDSVTETDE